MSIGDFDFLITKIAKKVASWKGKFLSMGGKLTLIQVVLGSVPIHILSVLKPPSKNLQSIEKLFSQFFWGEHGGKGKKAWISWKKVTKPREEGGLGIKALAEMMAALHTKLAWNVQTKDSLFAKFLKAKYLQGSGVTLQHTHNRSPLWSAIASQWNFLQANIAYTYNKYIWKPDQKGTFSFKSAWRTLRGNATVWAIAGNVWKSYIPLKLSVFFWRLWFKGIPTDDRIQRCAIPIVSKCSCCTNPSMENAEHLFFQSEVAQHTWNHFATLFGIDISHDSNWQQRCKNWWSKTLKNSQDMILASIVPTLILWELWKLRNEIRHEVSSFSMQTVIYRVLNWIRELNLLIKPKKKVSFSGIISLQMLNVQMKTVKIKRPTLVQWKPPTGNLLKLNIDGASKGNPGRAGCGGVVRNSSGDLILAFSEYLEIGTNNKAEMQGLYSGLLICYQLGIFEISVETDSQLLVHWFSECLDPPWSLLDIWQNIRGLADVMNIHISHVFREGNVVADALAKLGAGGNSEFYYCSVDLPTDVSKAWNNDLMGLPVWRNHNEYR